MIPAGVEVFIALVPIDLRWSFDRLAGLVEGHLGREACV
jgi:transposase